MRKDDTPVPRGDGCLFGPYKYTHLCIAPHAPHSQVHGRGHTSSPTPTHTHSALSLRASALTLRDQSLGVGKSSAIRRAMLPEAAAGACNG